MEEIVIISFGNSFPWHEMYVANSLKLSGYNPTVMSIFPNDVQQTYIEKLEELDPDKVIFWMQKPIQLAPYFPGLLDFVRRVPRHITTYFGGFFASSLKDKLADEAIFDHILYGYNAKELGNRLSTTPRDESIIDINGPVDMNDYKMDLSLLCEKSKYNPSKGLFSGYYTTFSCPNNCYYCYNNFDKSTGVRYSERDLAEVYNDIDVLTSEYTVSSFHFKELNFFHNTNRGFAVLDYLRQKGLRIQHNVDLTLYELTEDNIERLVNHGVRDVFYGLEDFDKESLKRLNKPSYQIVDQLENIANYANRYNLRLNSNIMLGLPWHDENAIRELLRKTLSMIEKHPSLYIHLVPYIPIQGTKLQIDYFPEYYKNDNSSQVVKNLAIQVGNPRNIKYHDQRVNDIDFDRLLDYSWLLLALKKGKRGGLLARLVRKIVKRQLLKKNIRSLPIDFLIRYLTRHKKNL